MAADFPSLETLLALEEAEGGPDVFAAPSHPSQFGVVYGGQFVGQGTAAAARTVEDEAKLPHALHSFYLRAGDPTRPVEYRVERLQDGRTTARRRVTAVQDGKPRWDALVSFQVDSPDAQSHQTPMPEVPGPEELPRNPIFHPAEEGVAEPVEVRQLLGEAAASLGGEDVGRVAMWMRAHGPLPADPVFHRAVAAYETDMLPMLAVLTSHRIPKTPSIGFTSLDHALWWRRTPSVGDWHLYVLESPGSANGRGLALGRLYARDGELVASSAQEGMIFDTAAS